MGTAGPQRPDGTPEYMPERLPEYMPARLPEYMPHRMPHRMPKYMRERMPHRMPEYMPDRTPKYIPDKMLEDMPDRMGRIEYQKEDLPDKRPEDSDTECQKILQIEYKIMSNRILVDHSKERHLFFFAADRLATSQTKKKTQWWLMTSLDGHGNFFAFPALIKATPPTNFANLFSNCSSSRTAGQRQHLRLWRWLRNEESNVNDGLYIYI